MELLDRNILVVIAFHMSVDVVRCGAIDDCLVPAHVIRVFQIFFLVAFQYRIEKNKQQNARGARTAL
jgi:hypothetical protein